VLNETIRRDIKIFEQEEKIFDDAGVDLYGLTGCSLLVVCKRFDLVGVLLLI